MEIIRIMFGTIILWLYFGIFPTILGAGTTILLCRDRKVSILENYIWGNIFLWAVFQLLSVPMGMLKVKFSVLTVVFSTIIMACIIIIIWSYRKSFNICLYKIRKFGWGEVLVAVLVLVQVLFLVFRAVYDMGADDAVYVVTSLDAVERDAIATINPYTGQETGASIKILLTSWNYYISFLGKISGIPVAVIAHTFLPIALIPIAYMVYGLLAKFMYNDNRKRCISFLLWVNLIIIFGAYSMYTLTFRLDICVWQGKAVMATIMLPFLFYYLFITQRYGKKEFVSLLLIMVATWAMSLMGVGLSIVIVIICFAVKYKKGDLKKLFSLLLAAIVLFSVAIFYIINRFSLHGMLFGGFSETFSQAVNMVLGAYSIYWNGSGMRWIYYISLLYMLLRRRKNEIDKYVLKYAVWQHMLLFNPIFYYIVYFFLRNPNIYVRLFYTLFPELYMAYAFTAVIVDLKEKKKQLLCAVVCSGIIVGTGTSYPSLANFSKADNLYKIPQEVIELCNIVNSNTDEEPKVMADESLVVYIRQYSSRIQMLCGRNSNGYKIRGKSIFDLVRNNEITMSEIVHIMKENDYQYLIWRYDQNVINEMEEMGGSFIGNTENYVVIRINEK